MFEPLSVRNMNKTKQLKIKLEIKKFKNNLLAKKFFREIFLTGRFIFIDFLHLKFMEENVR